MFPLFYCLLNAYNADLYFAIFCPFYCSEQSFTQSASGFLFRIFASRDSNSREIWKNFTRQKSKNLDGNNKQWSWNQSLVLLSRLKNRSMCTLIFIPGNVTQHHNCVIIDFEIIENSTTTKQSEHHLYHHHLYISSVPNCLPDVCILYSNFYHSPPLCS